MHPFAKKPREAIAALGEEGLIRAIGRWLGSANPAAPLGVGDDCAVLPRRTGRGLITVDSVIYGRHFDDSVSPRAVGAKLLKRNLSDLAAMGGRPVAAVLALIVDGRVSVRWMEDFHRGLAASARHYGVPLVGGDVSEVDSGLAASLTLLGAPGGARLLTRTGARTGDWIFVTGVLGGSLRSGHHHRFRPRLSEGLWLARRREVRAMMDVSDGLAKDLRALTPPGTRPALTTDALPRRRGCDLRATLTDGEDYELVFAVARSADRRAFVRAWRRAFPRTRLSWIGYFAPADRVPPDAVPLEDFHGYEHLR